MANAKKIIKNIKNVKKLYKNGKKKTKEDKKRVLIKMYSVHQTTHSSALIPPVKVPQHLLYIYRYRT